MSFNKNSLKKQINDRFYDKVILIQESFFIKNSSDYSTQPSDTFS